MSRPITIGNCRILSFRGRSFESLLPYNLYSFVRRNQLNVSMRLQWDYSRYTYIDRQKQLRRKDSNGKITFHRRYACDENLRRFLSPYDMWWKISYLTALGKCSSTRNHYFMNTVKSYIRENEFLYLKKRLVNLQDLRSSIVFIDNIGLELSLNR